MRDLSGRWQKWLLDSTYTIGAVALVAFIHFGLGPQFGWHTPFLVGLLAVLISAIRGGLVQGILATLFSLGLEIALWGDWQWLIPSEDNYHFIAISFYLLEGLVISLLAEYYLNGRRALHNSQARFQALFDAIPVGAMIHYQNKIVVANQTLADMFGYSLAELIGGRPTLIIPPDALAEAKNQLVMHEAAPIQMTALRRNGANFPAEMTSKTIDYQGRPMRVIMMRDLTDQLGVRPRLEQMDELLEARVVERTTALNNTVAELRLALEDAKTLSGLLSICGSCKRIRDDDGDWSQVEDYISAHSTAEFSHSLCPECLTKLRDEIADRHRQQDDRSLG